MTRSDIPGSGLNVAFRSRKELLVTLTKILFICHGNICRSAAAEVVMRELAAEAGRRDLVISSAAATREEIGHDIYPPMKKALTGAGYVCAPHAARQTVRGDYQAWDYLIGMDEENLWDMKRIYGGDPDGKISLLRDWAGEPGGEIEDPWYTGNFEKVYAEIEDGVRGLLESNMPNRQSGGFSGGKAVNTGGNP
jgi:protein-tyrosine phosphatase